MSQITSLFLQSNECTMNEGMIAKALLIVLSLSVGWSASAEEKFHKLKGA